jgi:hypothetical protein
VATKHQQPETLPSMEKIQAVEDKVASARSDLDMFLSTLRLIDGRTLSEDERHATWKVGGIDARGCPVARRTS